MMGKKLIDEARERIVVAKPLKHYVPKNHLLVKIDKAIDFSFIYDETECLYINHGTDSIDPVVAFKMLLIGYLYPTSERELTESIDTNIVYRYFIGYSLDEEIPNRSIFTRVRKRWGEECFRKIFNKVVQMCINAKLVDGKSASVDSTCVKANGVPEVDNIQREKSIENYLNKLSEDETIDLNELDKIKKESVFKADNSAKKKLYTVNTNHLEISPLSSKQYDPSESNKNWQVLRHDPDARFTRKGYPGYKVHRMVDHKYGIILSDIATPGNVADYIVLPDILRSFERTFNILHKHLAIDSGYRDQRVLKFADEMGYDIYTPITKSANTNKGMFGPGKFMYDEDRHILICPAGKEMELRKHDKIKKIYEFKAEVDDCNACPLKDKCTRSKSGRSSQISENEILIKTLMKKTKTKKHKQLMTKRQIYSEGSFGEAKTKHGMRHADFRGLQNMNIQALLTSIVQNVKKIIKYAQKPKVNEGKKFINIEKLFIRVLTLYYWYILPLLKARLGKSAFSSKFYIFCFL